MVKDFSWNIIRWNALLLEKTLKQLSILDIESYGFILNTCHDTAKRAETEVGFPVIFSRLRWPIEPKFSQVCYFIHKLWYTKCGLLDNTLYRKCPMALIEFFRLWCFEHNKFVSMVLIILLFRTNPTLWEIFITWFYHKLFHIDPGEVENCSFFCQEREVR